MLVTLNTSVNLLPDNQGKDTINRITSLLKGLKPCEPIQGGLLIRMIEIIINSNTVSR